MEELQSDACCSEENSIVSQQKQHEVNNFEQYFVIHTISLVS
jgi:hypothetical protein